MADETANQAPGAVIRSVRETLGRLWYQHKTQRGVFDEADKETQSRRAALEVAEVKSNAELTKLQEIAGEYNEVRKFLTDEKDTEWLRDFEERKREEER